MRKAGLEAIRPRSFVPRTTQSLHENGYWPNLLPDREVPSAPNKVWVSDITYLPLDNHGWLYLCVWMDLFSRMIVGWQLEDHMEEDLVVSPLRKALQIRCPEAGLITHSDRGGQYRSKRLVDLVSAWKIRPSMSKADDPYDNAFAESFWGRFKTELLEGGTFCTVEEARIEIFDFIEVYYNRKRRHSAIGYRNPTDYEQEYYKNTCK